MSYRKEICALLAKHCDLSHAFVLEIGSDANLEGLSILSEMGAKLVIASNRGVNWSHGSIPERAMVADNVDGRALRIGSASFDVILGTAVLEHIFDLPAAFAEFNRVLKPGGLLCVHGGPLWSCVKGHHVWLDVEGVSYRFNDDSLNPVPPWGHLLYTESELSEKMVQEKSLSLYHASAIAKWIFNNDELNRVTYTELIDVATNCGFEIIESVELTWSVPEAGTIEEIARRGRYGSDQRFDVSDVRLVMRKPASR